MLFHRFVANDDEYIYYADENSFKKRKLQDLKDEKIIKAFGVVDLHLVDGYLFITTINVSGYR